MNSNTLKAEIVAWLKNLPYWNQFVGEKLLNGMPITDKLIDSAYELFLEDEGLASKTIIRNSLQLTLATVAIQNLTTVKLTEIKDMQGVNALAANQQMQFAGQLSIVYGNNGTGKSGYIRMFNNAFNGRGDKDILANVFDQGSKSAPSCVLSFDEGGTTRSTIYQVGKADPAFTRFSVFDTLCGRIHLEEENTLHFTPGGFDFFNQYTAVLERLKVKLNEDVNKRTKLNTFSQMFMKGGNIEVLISGLNAKSDLEKLSNIAVYSQEDSDRYQQLTGEKSQLQALNISVQIQEKEDALKHLSAFKENCSNYLVALSVSALDDLNKQANNFLELQQIVQEDGNESLIDYQIQSVGSPEWRQFIVAAQNYAAIVSSNREAASPYPTELDACLFCLQPLSTKETALIQSYWKLLRSEAENKLKASQKWFADKLTLLSKYPTLFFDESISLFKTVQMLNPIMAEKWKKNVNTLNDAMKKLKSDLVSSLTSDITPIVFTTEELQVIEVLLKKQIEELKTKDPVLEIAKLDQEIGQLNDRNILSKVIGSISSYVEDLKWIGQAMKSGGSLRTNSVTSKQGELFDKYVTGEYARLFTDECKRLKVPGSIQVSQRNMKGRTLRRLQIFSTGVSRILSEGEQRAACLADFLTEVQLNPFCCGVIFDDPVTSLDHERREDIAKRLVELAATKQVIIFTHDIAFLHRLMSYSNDMAGLASSVVTLRRFGGKIGVIEPDLPWIAQPTKKRIGYLKDKLVTLQKIEKTKSEDDYISAAKTWYGLLREGWERAVEERLLKGVVERFNPGIQTQKLKQVNIDPQFLKDIETGMTESSKWVHDSAAGLNPMIPNTAEAMQNLALFEKFAAACPPA